MGFQPEFLSIQACDRVDGPAVVIDVMRAFTTAAWAFHLGVERIVLCAETEEALRVKARLPGALALKDAQPLPGFELSNSPVELQQRPGLAGRTIVQRTTAGTVGAVAARRADPLYCASFVCARATADALRAMRPRKVSFIVTGEDGAGDEDLACAEYIAALLAGSADPAPFLERAAASRAAETLRERIARRTPGVHPLDVDACLEADRFDFVMRAREEDGLLVLRSYNGRDG